MAAPPLRKMMEVSLQDLFLRSMQTEILCSHQTIHSKLYCQVILLLDMIGMFLFQIRKSLGMYQANIVKMRVGELVLAEQQLGLCVLEKLEKQRSPFPTLDHGKKTLFRRGS